MITRDSRGYGKLLVFAVDVSPGGYTQNHSPNRPRFRTYAVIDTALDSKGTR